MRRILHLIILLGLSITVQAQHTFKGTSLSDALIELDKSSKHYDISFVYDELEDFTVTKTIKRGHSLPEAVREVCGFYPVRVTVKGRDILVECIQKDRTKLRGRLVGPDRQPVAYANITLSPPSDTVLIGGGVSNEAGDFVIPCGAERTRVRISCVGFKTIEREVTVGDIGTIRMQMENNYLSDVTVSGRMSVIRSEAGRLQYIVSNDEFARGLNAQELLNRVPMVSTAGGRAMILGKGPARFMLNGRITEMGDEAIQQRLWTMRSEDIDRIEVISIPTGRDVMEMGGGYINIVMRRDQTLGWRGDISAEGGISDDWSGRGSGSVSYASEKFDMTVDAHGRYTTQTTDNLMKYHVSNEIDCISETRTKQTDKELTAKLTFRYLPIKNLELGAMLSWQNLWPERITEGTITYSGQSLWSEAGVSPDDNTSNRSLIAYCDWRLDTKGKMLSLTYNNFKKNDDAQTDVSCTSPSVMMPENRYAHESIADYHIQSGRLDLSLPFNYVTIDAGASYTSINNKGHLLYTSKDLFNYSLDHYDYQEKTKAAYLSLHRDWKILSIKIGLRYEHIGLNRDKDGKYISMNNYDLYTDYGLIFGRIFTGDYWLPSFNFSVKLKDGHQVSLTWGTNTIRHNFYDLNPLRIYKTGYEYFEGNPGLKPSRTSDIELNYHNHHGIFASGYHHHISNVLEQTTGLGILDDQVLYVNTSPVNNGRIDQTGLYMRYQHQLTPNLLATAEGETYYQDFEAMGLAGSYLRNLYGWGERLGISADWYLNRQHTLLLNTRYHHWFSDYTGATKTDDYGYFYFALRYSMLNDCLRFSLVVNDPFHQYVTNETMNNIYSSQTKNSTHMNDYQYSHTNHHAHYIGLTATYSFGGKKVRRIQHDMKDTESQRAEKH